jgi:hypothetical protein
MIELTCLSRSKHKCPCLPSSEDSELETKGLHQHQASRCNTKNWRLHQYTRRKRQPQGNKSYPRSLNSSRPRFRDENPLTLVKSFRAHFDSLTALTLEVSRQGFDKVLSVASTLQPSTSANKDNPHILGKSKSSTQLRYHRWVRKATVKV